MRLIAPSKKQLKNVFFFSLFHSVLLCTLFSCSSLKKETPSEPIVTIIKQWHASPSKESRYIEESLLWPEYPNQREIYDYLEAKIINKEPLFLLAEGCQEGASVERGFTKPVNGWSFKDLRDSSLHSRYPDIISSIPLKLKAKYAQSIEAYCADDLQLIHKHQLSLSDAKGYIGFYLRLKQFQSKDVKSFLKYKQALEQSEKQTINEPVRYTKEKALKALEAFQKLLLERNAIILKNITRNLKHNPILVVGGLHAQDLMDQLTLAGVKTQVITPSHYPQNSENLIQELKNKLEI
jgi:hypothetical protein